MSLQNASKGDNIANEPFTAPGDVQESAALRTRYIRGHMIRRGHSYRNDVRGVGVLRRSRQGLEEMSVRFNENIK